MLTLHDAHFSNSQVLTVKQCIKSVIWKLDNITDLDEQTFYRNLFFFSPFFFFLQYFKCA